jgi:selenocysteine-specific translation elongation factor
MVNIAALGDPEMASNIGKKGSASDITMYNYKGREGDITFMYPHRYPERIPPLLYSVNLSHGAMISVENIDKTLGEELVALELRGIEQGIFILKNYILPEQIAPLLKDTSMQSYEFMDDPIEIRERLTEFEMPGLSDNTLIPIDHFFPVKGVGTVVLGTVLGGEVEVHQELQVYPYEKKVQVRSIQVHDRDRKEASVGSRVGLALKNTDVSELERGITLAEPGSMITGKRFKMKPRLTKYWKGELKEGMVIHLSSGTQFIPGRMQGPDEIELDRKIAFSPGENILMVHLESMPRVFGITELEVIE